MILVFNGKNKKKCAKSETFSVFCESNDRDKPYNFAENIDRIIMKKRLAAFAVLAVISLVTFVSCGKTSPEKDETGSRKDREEEVDGTDSGKKLIVYYSYTGHCHEIVSALSSSLEADVLRIRETDDGADYNAGNYKLGSDLINAINNAPSLASSYPAIRETDKNAGDYDTIIVVTPLWHGRMAAIMQTYLFQNGAKMSGKNIGLIVSSSSSGISGVESDARRLIPGGKFYGSLWINGSNHSRRAELVKEWIQKNKI